MIYYDRSQECLYLIGDSATEKVFHSVPQRVVLESLAVATNLSGIIADRNNVSNNIFICGCKSSHKKFVVVVFSVVERIVSPSMILLHS
jgi:hypothetical protein